MTGGNPAAELSTMMNVFIASLLYAVPRDTVRMVLLDLNGDGLSLWKGLSLLYKGRRTKRIQGPIVTPEECGKIADYLRASN